MMLKSRISFQTKNYKVIPNLIWNLPHKLFMSKQQTTSVEDPGVRAALASSEMTLWDKRQTARVEDPETSSGITCFKNGNGVGRRSRTKTFRDDSLCFYERQAAHGFTLIELLVVVLIIGILAAVALPQYQKAVEKSRLTEVLSNIKTIETNYNLFLLAGGATSENVCLKDMGSAMELTGGTWAENGCTYTTPYFKYFDLTCDPSSYCHGEISRIPNYDYTLWLDNRNDGYIEHVNTCYTQDTDLGRFICKSIESLGWKYIDEEY